jgi:peptidoglycan/LPS O-acetylase OafA/YrhL
MFHSRRTPDTALLKLLASVAALGLLACLSAAALVGMGTLARSPMLATSVVLVIAALALGLRRLVAEIADRRRAEDLGASELTTLTFPPEPRVQRTRPSQLR